MKPNFRFFIRSLLILYISAAVLSIILTVKVSRKAVNAAFTHLAPTPTIILTPAPKEQLQTITKTSSFSQLTKPTLIQPSAGSSAMTK